jgi:hypothetical protein
MKTSIFGHRVVIFVALLLLSACNESGTSSSFVASGGIGGTGMVASSNNVSVGPITGFGSVFVNGVKYDTTNAVIMVNGQQVTDEALKLGMVVRVEGRVDSSSKTGTATRIDFNENVIGPVQMIDREHNRLKVLGQMVSVDRLTLFEGFSKLDELKVGDVLEVSGLINAKGYILATRIARLAEITSFEVRGRIDNHDPATQTFTIGELTVDYSEPLVFEDVPFDAEFVDIQGVFVEDRFVATRFTVEQNTFVFEVGTEIELYGVVTRFKSPSDFEVSDLPVTTTPETVFIFGTAADLAQNAELAVRGFWNADSVLVVEYVEFVDTSSNRTGAGQINLEAKVEAIDGVNNRVTLLGVSVQTTNNTVFLDERDKLSAFGLKDLRIGDDISVFGFMDLTTGAVIAEMLVREPLMFVETVWLGGPIKTVDVAARSLNLLGVTVMVDEKTLYVDDSLVEEESATSEPETTLIVIPPEDAAVEDDEIDEIVVDEAFPSQDELVKLIPETATVLTVDEFFSRVQPNLLIDVAGSQVGDVVMAKLLVILPPE